MTRPCHPERWEREARTKSKDRRISVAAFIAVILSGSCLALYVWSTARDVMWGDGLELVASAITNGVAHPPGYPLWIVLAHLASLLPIGAPAFRVNLTGGAYHAATVGLVYATAYVLTRRHAASLFAALLLALGSPLFVVWSLQAEVFSLNDFFAALIVLLCVLWLDDARRWRLVLPLGGLFGLGLSNHQTMILLAPLVMWTAWCGRHAFLQDKRVPATVGLSALAFAFCFAVPQIHTLWVSQTLPDVQLGVARTVPQLLDVVARRTYGSFQLAPSPEQQGGTFPARVISLIAVGGWPFAFVAAGIGALALTPRYKELGAAVVLFLFSLLVFCAVANNRVDDEVTRGIWARFGLLPLVTLAPFSACAYAYLASLLRSYRVGTAATVLVFCALVTLGVRQVLALSLANADGPRTYSRDIFNALPRGAILLTAGDAADLAPLYFQTAEGWRPDVIVIADEALRVPRITQALADRINVPAAVTLPLRPRDTARPADRGQSGSPLLYDRRIFD